MVAEALGDIADIDINALDDIQRAMIHLPRKQGGLGLTSYGWIASHCYAASSEPQSDSQDVRVEFLNNSITALIDDNSDWKLHRREAARRGASLWLTPSMFGSTIKDQSFAHCVQQRIRVTGATIKTGVKCSGCGCSSLAPLAFLDHCLGCARRKGENSTTRHSAVKRSLHEFALTCGFQVANEPPLQGTDDERPDLLLERGGTAVYVDVTGFNLLAPSYVARKENSVVRARYDEKKAKYEKAAHEQGAEFVVFGMTSLGALTAEATSLIRRLCSESPFPVDPQAASFGLAGAVANANGRILASANRELRCTFGRSPLSVRAH
jgi:hypothetical protein